MFPLVFKDYYKNNIYVGLCFQYDKTLISIGNRIFMGQVFFVIFCLSEEGREVLIYFFLQEYKLKISCIVGRSIDQGG